MNSISPRTERRHRKKETSRLLKLIRAKNRTSSFQAEISPPLESEQIESCIEDIPENITSPSWSEVDIIQDVQVSNNIQISCLLQSLRVWASNHNVTHMCVKDLIQIVNPHVRNILPTDPRTLLKTPRTISIEKISGGEFIYFGIETGISRRLGYTLSDCQFPIVIQWQTTSQFPILSLSIGIDGVPITKSSTKSFWPILGILNQVQNSSPFVIGLFCGMSKPTDRAFLNQFINEAESLEKSGIKLGELQYNFKISCLLADAPGRSLIKGCKQHNSYNSCERCVQEGEWLGRVILKETNCTLRTDENFCKRADPDHHVANTGSWDWPIGPVTQVVLDHMHLVFLGVAKKLLCYWVKGKLPHRLSSKEVLSLSKNLLKLRPFIPRDFQRKPRALSELAHFKATEFRMFLLYTGIVVLGEVLSTTKFSNFLKLHSAMSILLSPNASVKSWNELARSLLTQFVQEVQVIYGLEFMVYNVHSLIHIADDAMNFGNLSNVSAFPFESFMQKIKRMLHAKNYQLTQVAKRLSEMESILVDQGANSAVRGIIFTNSKYNNCYCLDDGKIILLKEFVNSKCCHFYEIIKVGRFPNYPFNSLSVGICLASISSNVVKVMVQNVRYKCLLLPYKNIYVCLPMLHTM